MSFRTAIGIILALLVVPLAGVVFILVSDKAPARHSRSHAAKETSHHHEAKPAKAKHEALEPSEPEPLAPVKVAASSVILSGESAKSASGLSGRLSWVDDGEGSHITNPCKASGCLGEAGVKLCAKGKVARTAKSSRPRWGAELTWNLHEDAGGIHPLGKSRVKGLSFVLDLPLAPKPTPPDDKAKANQETVSSSKPDAESPVKYLFALRVGDTDYCAPIRAGKNNILFTDLRKDCTARRNRQTKIPAGIVPEAKVVKWKVPSLEDTVERFEFCLSKLSTIDR